MVIWVIVDWEGQTLCPWPEALDRRTLIGDGVEDDQVFRGQVVVVLGIGRRALQHAGDVLGGVLRHEPQDRGGLFHRLALDRRGDESGLPGGAAKELGLRPDLHDRRPYFSDVDRSVCLPWPR